jgi:hypothetical protein
MKRIILAAFAGLIFATAGLAQPPKGPANKGDVYGAQINEKGAVSIKKLPAMLEKKDSISTKVVAKVIDVCPKKGCWINLQIDENTTAFVKMKDYGFFVPTELAGKTVVLEGDAFVKTTSVEELKHYAEDAKKSKEEIEAIKEPKKEIRFIAKGIRVVE